MFVIPPSSPLFLLVLPYSDSGPPKKLYDSPSDPESELDEDRDDFDEYRDDMENRDDSGKEEEENMDDSSEEDSDDSSVVIEDAANEEVIRKIITFKDSRLSVVQIKVIDFNKEMLENIKV